MSGGEKGLAWKEQRGLEILLPTDIETGAMVEDSRSRLAGQAQSTRGSLRPQLQHTPVSCLEESLGKGKITIRVKCNKDSLLISNFFIIAELVSSIVTTGVIRAEPFWGAVGLGHISVAIDRGQLGI